jgi:hypothetical protein
MFSLPFPNRSCAGQCFTPPVDVKVRLEFHIKRLGLLGVVFCLSVVLVFR